MRLYDSEKMIEVLSNWEEYGNKFIIIDAEVVNWKKKKSIKIANKTSTLKLNNF